MRLGNTGIEFEENDERMKIEIPLVRSTPAIIIFSLLLIVWIVGLIAFISLLFGPTRESFLAGVPRYIQIFWILGVMLWIYVWIRYLGRSIARWWQFHIATRELMFIEKNTLIVRRPVSLLGLTDAYDRRYIAPFYRSESHNALAFQYGNVKHILFALTLPEDEQQQLLSFLNNRYFPDIGEEDEEDDEDGQAAYFTH